MACILKTVFKNALLKTVFSGGRLGAGVVVGCQISIQPYTNVKQPICSKLKVKNTDIICYMLTWLVYFQQGNLKNKNKKLMKIVNAEKKHLHIFPTTWEISMKFSGKICLMIISKVTKSRVLPLL